MHVIFTVAIIILLSFGVARTSKKVKMPSVVALILMGLFLDLPQIRNALIYPNSEFVFSLGDLGLLCLMFVAGLESSWMELYEERRDSAIIAFFGSMISFATGFVVFSLMGYSILVSSVVGICMSVTAEATRAQVLLELKKLKTRVGAAMMGAGIVDDIIGLGLFLIVTSFLKQFFFKEDMLIAGAIMAFFLGVVMQKSLGRDHKHLSMIEKTIMIFVVPFFFVSIGLHFEISSIGFDFLLPVIIFIAIAGKLLGAFITKPFTNFSFSQLHLIGWSMNSRGVMGLAIALVAFRMELISPNIYSSLVIMAIVTTIIFPFIVAYIVKRNGKIMN